LLFTRLKRLPVISREHLRNTRTNYFYKHLFGISKAIGISNTNVLQIPIGTSNANWYFQCRLVLRVTIGTSSNNWYFEYQLVLRVPIVTSSTNCYFEYQLVLRVPIVTSSTNCYFEYQLLLQLPIGTSTTDSIGISNIMSNQQQGQPQISFCF
jgi:hypothetical protein